MEGSIFTYLHRNIDINRYKNKKDRQMEGQIVGYKHNKKSCQDRYQIVRYEIKKVGRWKDGQIDIRIENQIDR